MFPFNKLFLYYGTNGLWNIQNDVKVVNFSLTFDTYDYLENVGYNSPGKKD